LAKTASNPKAAKSRPGMDKSVRLAVNMLTKVLLQYVQIMQQDRDFYSVWAAALTSLQDCMAIKQEGVMESVPENAKNMLLVLASSGVLTPQWTDAHGRSLWELTWSKGAMISSGLHPSMLTSVGISQPPSPLSNIPAASSEGGGSAAPDAPASSEGAAEPGVPSHNVLGGEEGGAPRALDASQGEDAMHESTEDTVLMATQQSNDSPAVHLENYFVHFSSSFLHLTSTVHYRHRFPAK